MEGQDQFGTIPLVGQPGYFWTRILFCTISTSDDVVRRTTSSIVEIARDDFFPLTPHFQVVRDKNMNTTVQSTTLELVRRAWLWSTSGTQTTGTLISIHDLLVLGREQTTRKPAQ